MHSPRLEAYARRLFPHLYANTDALGYATRLAEAIYEKHYRDDAPEWKPLPDLLGLLTQIDNMTAGLTRTRANCAGAATTVSADREGDA
jgi:hypothetical protein